MRAARSERRYRFSLRAVDELGIKRLATDSRHVRRGDTFVACPGAHLGVPDRARAIRQEVAAARRGDVVLIAGKGHERYQESGGVRRPFNDAAVAQAALRGI